MTELAGVPLSAWMYYNILISAFHVEKDEILSDVTSRLWFTYRKNFPPIGKLKQKRSKECGDWSYLGFHI